MNGASIQGGLELSAALDAICVGNGLGDYGSTSSEDDECGSISLATPSDMHDTVGPRDLESGAGADGAVRPRQREEDILEEYLFGDGPSPSHDADVDRATDAIVPHPLGIDIQLGSEIELYHGRAITTKTIRQQRGVDHCREAC